MPMPAVLSGHRSGLALGALVAALALVACTAPGPVGRGRVNPAATTGLGGQGLPALAQAVKVFGEVRLLSNNGSGIVSNNSGALISDQGGGIVSNNSGANRMPFGLLQAKAPPEARLAEAVVAFLDSAGAPLRDAAGKALEARTDASGRYEWNALLPGGRAVVQVKPFSGGALRAMLVVGPEESSVERHVGTASSLGAAYVLNTLVRGQASQWAKLPAAEVKALDAAAEGARLLLGAGAPKYEGPELVALAEKLKGQDQAFGDRLRAIEALLLVGQKQLGQGLLATQVALSGPVGIMDLGDRGVLVIEALLGRPRLVDPQGRIQKVAYVAPPGILPAEIQHSLNLPDGRLLLSDHSGHRILAVDADLKLSVVAGDGSPGSNGEGVDARLAQVESPGAMALDPTGGFWAEASLGNLIHVDAQGKLTRHAFPPDKGRVVGMGGLPNGELVIYPYGGGGMFKRALDGSWSPFPVDTELGGFVKMAPDGERGFLVHSYTAKGLGRLSFDGQFQAIPGGELAENPASPEGEGKLRQVAGMLPLPQGDMLLAEKGAGRVRRLNPAGQLSTVAGASGFVGVGQGQSLPLNAPGQIVADADGSILIPERGASSIKRLKGTQVSLFAGGVLDQRQQQQGPTPLAQLRMSGPTSLARDPKSGTLYIGDGDSLSIRAVGADGVVRTLVGARLGTKVEPGFPASGEMPAEDFNPGSLGAMAVDPQGRLHFACPYKHAIFRLDPDGMVRVAAGQVSATAFLDFTAGAKAKRSPEALRLLAPIAVQFDPQGRMLVADSGHLVVWRQEADGHFEAIMGLGLGATLAIVNAGGSVDGQVPKPASEADLVVPMSIAFGPDGSMYVGDAGTKGFDGFGARFGSVPRPTATLGARIHRVSPAGISVVVAGSGAKLMNGEGEEEELGMPSGLAFDQTGRLLVSDTLRNQLRAIPAAALLP